MPNPKMIKKRMKNGMKIVMIPMKTSKIISMGIFIRTGSRYENKKNKGMAHFLEHMMFKGTKNMKSSKITEKLDSVGARPETESPSKQ